MFFGDKKEFGINIEFDKNSNKFAYIVLYVKNQYIGKLDEVTYIESSISSIDGEFIDRMNSLPEKYKNLSCEEIFNIRYPDDEWAEYPEELDNITISGLEDTFDSFSMLAYKINDDEIIFCWTLWDEYFRDKSYPKGIHTAKLNYPYIKNTIKKAVEYVSNVLDN